MKRLLFIAFSCLATKGYSQVIEFPFVKQTMTIDGNLTSSEWGNSNSVKIPVNSTDSVLVRFQHDSTAMYFVFTGKLESANALFPEILFDPAKDRGSNWINGQWWMHVSATDCENNGGYGVYTNCAATQPGWQGAPNFSAGMPYTDTVEIKVPFSKIGFNLTNDTIGLSFVVTNTATTFKLWPASANKDVPSTWGKAVFAKFPVGINDADVNNDIAVSPNPVMDVLNIGNIKQGADVTLTDLSGKVILKTKSMSTSLQISTANYTTGTYILVVDNGKTNSKARIIKQ